MNFTEEQRQIIEHLGGHELIVACPGSGKTTTILEKVNYMVKEKGVNPREILVVTFTKAAAQEMTSRFQKKYPDVQGICFSTIHAICFAILRTEYKLNANNILKDWEAQKCFRTYMKNYISNTSSEDAAEEVIGRISSIRNAGLDPCKIIGDTIVVCNTEIPFKPMYEEYETLKKMSNKIDFDDMLILCLELLKTNKAALNKYQSYYKYIIIDEYQDTNKVQANIFYLLSEKSGNLCIVGDDDQSIYGFRAADSGIMLKFPQKFPDTIKFSLSTNYRCGRNIVTVAERLIKHNKERFHKKFEAGTNFDGDILIGGYEDANDEVRNIVEWIKEKHAEGIEYKNLAILYRVNNEVINMMPLFKEAEIPIAIREKPGDIHKHFIFEAIYAYYMLTTMFDKDSEELPTDTGGYLRKIINCPSRYVKPEYFEKCTLSDESIERCIKKYIAADSNARRRREMMADNMYNLRCLLLSLKGATTQRFLRILKAHGFENWIKDTAEYRGLSYENAKSIYESIVSEAKTFETMEQWIAYTGDYEEYLTEVVNSTDGVRLSTFHGAKGLEWQCVRVVNASTGCVPYGRSIREGGDKAMEEERRLFYVAITRAKEELQISFVKNNSQFIGEMLGENISPKEWGRQLSIAEVIAPKNKKKVS